MNINALRLGRYEVRNSKDGIQYFIDGNSVTLDQLEQTSADFARLVILHHRFDLENKETGLRHD
ncbi:hypothetical protein QU24_23810 [Pantoea rodasii]|uniref:Uncharacterized protein n=1 Tax=Pantoea rodasii TaxID=1076549 RepID=A0A0B1R1T5_9GAMM|nr:hypothetical protein QU24_23810 [Pantoea rodasii]